MAAHPAQATLSPGRALLDAPVGKPPGKLMPSVGCAHTGRGVGKAVKRTLAA